MIDTIFEDFVLSRQCAVSWNGCTFFVVSASVVLVCLPAFASRVLQVDAPA